MQQYLNNFSHTHLEENDKIVENMYRQIFKRKHYINNKKAMQLLQSGGTIFNQRCKAKIEK